MALVIVCALFVWLSAYYVVINSQVAQYGALKLYEPNHIIRWLEFGGSIAMLGLGIYVFTNILRRK